MKNFVFFTAVFFVFSFVGCETRGCYVPGIRVEVSAVEEGANSPSAAVETSSAVAQAEAELAKAEWRLASATSEGERKVWQDRWQRARVQLDTARAEAASAAKPAMTTGQPAVTPKARDAPGSWPWWDWRQKSIFWCLVLVFSWLAGVLILRDANEIWGAAFPLVFGLAGAAFLATSPDEGGYPVRLLFAGVSGSLAALALYRPGPEFLGIRVLGGLGFVFLFYTLI